MLYNPKIHNRKTLRLKGYDYAQAGLYFITIDCQGMTHLFGKIQNGKMILNEAGKIIKQEWENLPNTFPNTKLDKSIIMPNHIHGIIEILPHKSQEKIKTLGEIIGYFKSITTHKYIKGVKNKNWTPFPKRLWHRNFYEKIIRSQRALTNIQNYIQKNPKNF